MTLEVIAYIKSDGRIAMPKFPSLGLFVVYDGGMQTHRLRPLTVYLMCLYLFKVQLAWGKVSSQEYTMSVKKYFLYAFSEGNIALIGAQ